MACLLLFLTVALVLPTQSTAADVRTGDDVSIPETATGLTDLYLFGGTITLDAPVTNDLVIGGGDIILNGDITGDLLGGGGNITMWRARCISQVGKSD